VNTLLLEFRSTIAVFDPDSMNVDAKNRKFAPFKMEDVKKPSLMFHFVAGVRALILLSLPKALKTHTVNCVFFVVNRINSFTLNFSLVGHSFALYFHGS
jgi:hypothetical protein